MGDGPAFLRVTDPLEPAELARAVAMLLDEEIPHRVAGDAIEVPADVETDAIAVLAALDADDDPGPDQVADFARCTARVNAEPFTGVDAMSAVLALRAQGIQATSDAPGGIGGTEVIAMAQCHVLVAPEDLVRARDAVAGLDGAQRTAALLTLATETVAAGLPAPVALAIEQALVGAEMLTVLLPNADDLARVDIRVRPVDGPRAGAIARGVAERFAEAAAAPAAGADREAAQPLVPASLVLFLVLIGVVYLLMKSCR